jgi:subfamily B ATP-binding cassette protein MsbA
MLTSDHELPPAVITVQVSLLGVTPVHDSEPGVTGDHSSPNILPVAIIFATAEILPTPNNIAFGLENVSDEEIIEAAKIANAYNFISKKEDGFNSNIGDRGSKLSGGERQRLTIARAVLKNPPILILDEATSSLDTESERLVQDAINNMMQNRTSIVIAHRLSTIRNADEIIVLQNGSIVERGTHDSLIAKDGFYNKLVQMQEVK